MMEIEKNYKQTEVGVIPEDWEIEQIQNPVDITTGNRDTQDRIPDGQYPFFVRSQTVERINTYSFDGEAVLTAGDGVGTGKVFHYINGKFDFHQRVYKMSGFSKEKLDGFYFYLYFSQNFFNRIMQMTAKSSVDSVRREMIAKMLLPLPTKAEQTAIATVLNDADALIQKLEQLIAQKRNIKTAAMQELLKPKEGWECKRIVELGFIKSSSVDKVIRPNEKIVRLLNYMDVYSNAIITEKTVSGISSVNSSQSNSFNLLKGDVVFTPTSETPDDIGHASLITTNLKSTVFSYHLTRLRFTADIIVDELKPYIFNSKALRDYFTNKATGSTRFVLKKGDFEEAPIFYPKSKSEQTRIAQILSDMDNEIQELEKQLEKYKKLKQGMMQVLLTGKIRLVKP